MRKYLNPLSVERWILPTLCILVPLFALAFSGCGASSSNSSKGVVKIYSGGKLVKEYKSSDIGRYNSADSWMHFYNREDGKAVHVSGTIIIEDE